MELTDERDGRKARGRLRIFFLSLSAEAEHGRYKLIWDSRGYYPLEPLYRTEPLE